MAQSSVRQVHSRDGCQEDGLESSSRDDREETFGIGIAVAVGKTTRELVRFLLYFLCTLVLITRFGKNFRPQRMSKFFHPCWYMLLAGALSIGSTMGSDSRAKLSLNEMRLYPSGTPNVIRDPLKVTAGESGLGKGLLDVGRRLFGGDKSRARPETGARKQAASLENMQPSRKSGPDSITSPGSAIRTPTRDLALRSELDEELGKVADKWVSTRGIDGGEQVPVEDLQKEIDDLIDRWATDAMQAPTKNQASAEASRSDASELPSPDISPDRLRPGDAQINLGRPAGLPMGASSDVAALEADNVDWDRVNWVDSEAVMLGSQKALDDLAAYLEKRGLGEMWVDPDGDSCFVTIAQQLAMQHTLRPQLEAEGYDFGLLSDFEDGIFLRRYPDASRRCRVDVVGYMSSEPDLLAGFTVQERRMYLNAVRKSGVWCGLREVKAAAQFYGVEIQCLVISERGLKEHRFHPAGASRATLKMVKCGAHFWSIVPEILPNNVEFSPDKKRTEPRVRPAGDSNRDRRSPRGYAMGESSVSSAESKSSAMEVRETGQQRSDLPQSGPSITQMEAGTNARAASVAKRGGEDDSKGRVVSFIPSQTSEESSPQSNTGSQESSSSRPPRRQYVFDSPDTSNLKSKQKTPPAASEEEMTFLEWQKKLRHMPSVVSKHWAGEEPTEGHVGEQHEKMQPTKAPLTTARSEQKAPKPLWKRPVEPPSAPADEPQNQSSGEDEILKSVQRYMKRDGKRVPGGAMSEDIISSQVEDKLMEEFFKETIDINTPRPVPRVQRPIAAKKRVSPLPPQTPPAPPTPPPPPVVQQSILEIVGVRDTVDKLVTHMQEMEDKRAQQLMQIQEQNAKLTANMFDMLCSKFDNGNSRSAADSSTDNRLPSEEDTDIKNTTEVHALATREEVPVEASEVGGRVKEVNVSSIVDARVLLLEEELQRRVEALQQQQEKIIEMQQRQMEEQRLLEESRNARERVREREEKERERQREERDWQREERRQKERESEREREREDRRQRERLEMQRIMQPDWQFQALGQQMGQQNVYNPLAMPYAGISGAPDQLDIMLTNQLLSAVPTAAAPTFNSASSSGEGRPGPYQDKPRHAAQQRFDRQPWSGGNKFEREQGEWRWEDRVPEGEGDGQQDWWRSSQKESRDAGWKGEGRVLGADDDPLLGKTRRVQIEASEALERVKKAQADLDVALKEAETKKDRAERLRQALDEVQSIRESMAETSERMSELHLREKDLQRGLDGEEVLRDGHPIPRKSYGGKAGKHNQQQAAASDVGGESVKDGTGKEDDAVRQKQMQELEEKMRMAEELNVKLEARLRQAESLLSHQQANSERANATKDKSPVPQNPATSNTNTNTKTVPPTSNPVHVPTSDRPVQNYEAAPSRRQEVSPPAQAYDAAPLRHQDPHMQSSGFHPQQYDSAPSRYQQRPGQAPYPLPHMYEGTQPRYPTNFDPQPYPPPQAYDAATRHQDPYVQQTRHQDPYAQQTRMPPPVPSVRSVERDVWGGWMDQNADAAIAQAMNAALPIESRPRADVHPFGDRGDEGMRRDVRGGDGGRYGRGEALRYDAGVEREREIRQPKMAPRGEGYGRDRVGHDGYAMGRAGGGGGGGYSRADRYVEEDSYDDEDGYRDDDRPEKPRRRKFGGSRDKQRKESWYGGKRKMAQRDSEELEAMLAEQGLSGYEKLLVRNGWDTFERMKFITEEDLVDIGVKKGHARVMVETFAKFAKRRSNRDW